MRASLVACATRIGRARRVRFLAGFPTPLPRRIAGASGIGCYEDHEHSHPHESKADAVGICVRLKQAVANQGVNFRVLLDPKGEAASRYHVSDLPACVLIDPEGCVRRRFTGGRRFDTLNAMLNEIISPEPASQTKLAAGAERGKP